jgi:hypothetical protein
VRQLSNVAFGAASRSPFSRSRRGAVSLWLREPPASKVASLFSHAHLIFLDQPSAVKFDTRVAFGDSLMVLVMTDPSTCAAPASSQLLDRSLLVCGRASPQSILAYTAQVVWSQVLDYSLEWQAQRDEHQLRLVELEKTTIVAKSGQTIAPQAHSAVKQAMEKESREIRSFVSNEYEGPFSKFVKLADHARPAILDLALTSTININGLTIDAETARSAAKAMKKDPDNGWKAIVRAAGQDDGWKATVRPERA